MVEGAILEEVDKVEHITSGQIVRKGRWNKLVDESRYTVGHRSEGGGKEADNRSASAKLLLAFGQHVGVGEFAPTTHRPRVGYF